MSIDAEVGYQKNPANNNPRTNSISISLVDSAAAIETTVWSNADSLTPGWVFDTATGVALPPNTTYERIRIHFDLHEQGNNEVSAWVDEIRIRGSGAGVLREAWREVFSDTPRVRRFCNCLVDRLGPADLFLGLPARELQTYLH